MGIVRTLTRFWCKGPVAYLDENFELWFLEPNRPAWDAHAIESLGTWLIAVAERVRFEEVKYWQARLARETDAGRRQNISRLIADLGKTSETAPQEVVIA